MCSSSTWPWAATRPRRASACRRASTEGCAAHSASARCAKELRARGAEAAEKIRASAERQRDILLAEAYRDAERTRGEGDARATAITGRAFSVNPEFYALYRSLNAYKESFKGKDDILVVDPSADFFKYFKNPRR